MRCTRLALPFVGLLLVGPICILEQPAAAQSPSNSAQSLSTSLDPSFEVATVKSSNPNPTDPNEAEWGIGTRANHFFSKNATVMDLISFAYEVHGKQISGGPPWCRTDRFDIEGVPNFEGKPIRAQLQTMLRKLLADRFRLKVHTEKQELPEYALVVSNDGLKFHKTDAPPEAGANYGFSTRLPVTQMNVMHMTMPVFASALQRTMLDRPVVDQTGLPDRYDFALRWTPDDSQFSQLRGAVTLPIEKANADADAPPGLFTAIRNQLGLRLEAKKAMVDVVAIDHIERPSAN